jgi:cytochrome P450
VWNGLVPADDVRAHLKQLSRQGVGYNSVAIAADVSRTVLAAILAGRKHQLRAQSARRVLAIDRDALADHALVKAAPTWRRLRRLLREGFTQTALARRLGSKARTPALQFRRRYILAKSAARVERFYQIVMVA